MDPSKAFLAAATPFRLPFFASVASGRLAILLLLITHHQLNAAFSITRPFAMLPAQMTPDAMDTECTSPDRRCWSWKLSVSRLFDTPRLPATLRVHLPGPNVYYYTARASLRPSESPLFKIRAHQTSWHLGPVNATWSRMILRTPSSPGFFHAKPRVAIYQRHVMSLYTHVRPIIPTCYHNPSLSLFLPLSFWTSNQLHLTLPGTSLVSWRGSESLCLKSAYIQHFGFSATTLRP